MKNGKNEPVRDHYCTRMNLIHYKEHLFALTSLTTHENGKKMNRLGTTIAPKSTLSITKSTFLRQMILTTHEKR